MEVKSVSKYVRISPQKVRKLVSAIKGKPVEAGLEILKFSIGVINGLKEMNTLIFYETLKPTVKLSTC